jgi:hypothetical protein
MNHHEGHEGHEGQDPNELFCPFAYFVSFVVSRF